jgi:rRNA biogenesis protein RRP5
MSSKTAIVTSHMNHTSKQRITVGMKILAQVVSIEPLALVVSLPNQLYGHVPITQISSELTAALESTNEDDEPRSDEEDEVEEGAEAKTSPLPDLFDLFRPGQYLRCVVAASHAAGTTKAGVGTGRAMSEIEKASRRVELSLNPGQVNQGVLKTDLKPGFVSDDASLS